MPAPRTVKLRWLDVNFRPNRTAFYVGSAVTDGEALSVIDDLAALSVAHVAEKKVSDHLEAPSVAAGGSGSYSGHRDLVTLYLSDASNSSTPVTVVAPDDGIFLSDNETVDPDNAWVDAAVTALLTFAASKTGAALVAFRHGRRWMQED